ncbi:unnamed protein product [Lactuca virosa]|uniref:Uncharacterized protein n=1 Tax=Lactuca virosa TaxID=75947 RepID=A0AAU9N4K5_9ASTR|nr:unnamed protein product [Lactuca virosa]
MAGDGSLREDSSLEEERTVLDDSFDTLEDGDESEPNYTLVTYPSEPALSPYYTLTGLELLSSEYEPDEDEEDTATSLETSPPAPLLPIGLTGHPHVLG